MSLQSSKTSAFENSHSESLGIIQPDALDIEQGSPIIFSTEGTTAICVRIFSQLSRDRLPGGKGRKANMPKAETKYSPSSSLAPRDITTRQTHRSQA